MVALAAGFLLFLFFINLVVACYKHPKLITQEDRVTNILGIVFIVVAAIATLYLAGN